MFRQWNNLKRDFGCSEPLKLDKTNDRGFLMKLTYEQKLKVYKEWKSRSKSPLTIARELSLSESSTRYFLRLADRYGVEVLKHGKNKHYSADEKIRIINRVLISHESATCVSLDEGLPSSGMLFNWMKSYTENGYTIIERKRGRKSNAKEENKGRAASGKQIPEGEEPEIRNRECILKKIRCLGFGKREVRKEEIAQAVTELRQELKCSLKFILEVIKANPSLPQITRSDYYYQSSKTDKDMKKDSLMNRIIAIYYHHKCRYGYRRITLQLRNEGIAVNHKSVKKRLMKKMGLRGITPRAKYKSYKGDFNGTVKNQLLDKVVDEENHKTYYERNFSATAPNQKWTTDISEFHIAAGKLYLSPILDMFNGEIVTYTISRSPVYAQVQNMLDKAFKMYPNLEGLIFQSDQGWQYQMVQYHRSLKDKGILQSMSRKGNCLDNCVMENFFGKMKNEMFYGHEYEFTSLDDLQKSMEAYIHYYNTERIQTKLKGLTPCEARLRALEY